MKGFLNLGSQGVFINIDYIDQDKCYLDKRNNMVAVFDIYGFRYNVDPRICKNKINWRS